MHVHIAPPGNPDTNPGPEIGFTYVLAIDGKAGNRLVAVRVLRRIEAQQVRPLSSHIAKNDGRGNTFSFETYSRPQVGGLRFGIRTRQDMNNVFQGLVMVPVPVASLPVGLM